jgi:hypothetical protein
MHPTRIFKTPDELYNAFEEYVKETKQNPRKKHVFVGKDGNSEFELLERPLTKEGFEIYCYDNYGCVGQYFDNKDGLYSDFVAICSRIKQAIRRDQIEGGMVGQYNPSITQRLNNLSEKTETKQVDKFDFDV